MGRKLMRPEKGELKKMYMKMTAREIADRCDVTEGTVRWWIWQYKITKRKGNYRNKGKWGENDDKKGRHD